MTNQEWARELAEAGIYCARGFWKLDDVKRRKFLDFVKSINESEKRKKEANERDAKKP